MLVISSLKEGETNDQITFKWPINLDGSMGSPEIEKYPMTVPETFSDRKGTCHFELKGEMYIVGGYDPSQNGSRDWLHYRQYKVVGNEITQLPDLNFGFKGGRCLNYDGENVLFIGDFNNDRDTWNFDGEKYVKLPTKSTYQHYGGGLARYTHNGEAGVVLTAGEFEYYGTTEFYTRKSNEWKYQNLTEGHGWLYGFTMATFDNQVYLFGGKIYFGNFSRDVWKMNDKFGFAKIPETMKSLERHDFSSFQENNRIVHFGGWDNQYAECWSMRPDGSWDIVVSDESWYNWTKYPMLFGI